MKKLCHEFSGVGSLAVLTNGQPFELLQKMRLWRNVNFWIANCKVFQRKICDEGFHAFYGL